MRNVIVALAAVGSLAAPALAHPDGHDRPQFEERKPIGVSAQEAVVKLVSQAKLPASWSAVKPLDSKVRVRNGTQQWVVSFRNNAIKAAAKRNLYVVMTMDGTFVSANHKLS